MLSSGPGHACGATAHLVQGIRTRRRAAIWAAATSTLAGRAVEGGAPRLDEAQHRPAAARLHASLPRAVVDAKAVLEQSQRAVGPSVIPQGRPAGLYGLFQNRDDGARQVMGRSPGLS